MNPNPDFSNISPATVQNIQNFDGASSSRLPQPQSQACASCKFQRRRCNPDCQLAPYFPANEQDRFLAVHRLYGVRNMLKILNKLDPLHHADAMRTIIYESEMWIRYPVSGCYGLICELIGYHEHLMRELSLTTQQLELCRAQQVIGGGRGHGRHEDYFSFDGNDDVNNVDVGVGAGFGNGNEIGIGIGIGNGNGFGNQYDVGSGDYSGNGVDMGFSNLRREEDNRNALVMLNEDVDQSTSNAVANVDRGDGSGNGVDFDHAIGSGTYHYSSEEARNGNVNSMGQMIQEHDLKGAASLFTLRSKDNSYL